MKQLTAWSNSRLALYEKCPAQLWYKAGEKLPAPKHEKAQRGIDVHEGLANWFKNEGEPTDGMWLATAIARFRPMMEQIYHAHPFVEEKWAFDAEWRQVGWFDKRVRYRSIIDVGVLWPDNAFSIVDWKTGKPYEDSADQMEQFSMSAFAALRSVNWIETLLEYVDTGQEIREEFSRSQFPALVEKWERRAAPLLNDKIFAPRPGPHCKSCPFAKSKGGPCAYG